MISYAVPSTRVRREDERRFLDAVPTKIFPNSDNNVTPEGRIWDCFCRYRAGVEG